MELSTYRRKRDFDATPEPKGARARTAGWSYVVQKHDARRLHFDFRLELGGVLLSWAVPKGPSIDPSVKRLAVQTEDHPVAYGDFEGTIPEGEYGGGTVMLWDRGTWEVEGGERAAKAAYDKGRLTFTLHGERLSGRWHLVRSRGKSDAKGAPSWLLFKGRDEASGDRGARHEPVDREKQSVASRRTMEEIHDARDRVWRSGRGEDRKPRGRRVDVPLPTFSAPALAKLVQAAPEGDAWAHEIKLDGYRILAHVAPGRETHLYTRSGKDWTASFPTIAAALDELAARSAVLDGELVAFDARGVSRFQMLQNRMKKGSSGEPDLAYVAFDLLHLDGEDLTGLGLEERKAKLASLLAEPPAGIRLGKHIIGHGEELLERARSLGLEGIVSKRRDATYRAGRTGDWLKVKCTGREELVVVGFTPPAGKRTRVGALALATRTRPRGPLRYAGKVGTGFTRSSVEELWRLLEPRVRATSPLGESGPEPPKGIHWVKPDLVVEVAFSEKTDDGLLRHPSFQGLRRDKPSEEVSSDWEATPKPPRASSPRARTRAPKELGSLVSGLSGRVRFTNLDKVLFAEAGVTKAALVAHYAIVAPRMLPLIEGRPLTLLRCPDGVGRACFFQKHATAGTPDVLERVRIKDDRSPYLVVRDADGLYAAAQHGGLELHVWGSRAGSLEKPDWLVFDLDPDEGLPWSAVVEAATGLRDFLRRLDLESWVKTTGGKGLHVTVPMAARVEWPEAKAFCRSVAVAFASTRAGKFVTTPAKSARRGKIFLDYLRNARGATAIAPYSTRANARALVATPVSWSELEAGVLPGDLDLMAVAARVQGGGPDPWRGVSGAKQTISAAARKAVVG